MALKRDKSNGLDWQDVNQAIVNLQAVLGGTIAIAMGSEQRSGVWDLVILATRERPPLEAQDQPPLVSVSVSCRALRFRELEAVCMQALHALDLACYAQNAYMPTKKSA